jgi:thioester reductase-like protein
MRVLLTGASGGVGTEVARGLLKRGHSVVAMIHRKRVLVGCNGKKIKLLEKSPSKVQAKEIASLKADVARPRLGLSQAGYQELQDSIDAIIHCAARIDFGRDADFYRPVNIDGTKHILELALGGARAKPLIYVSTAYVCGESNGLFTEDDLDIGQEFVVTYEESKFKAELLVQQAMQRSRDILIARPSIVVGASHNGATSTYNTIYPILRVLTGGKVRSMPAEYTALLNLIPVDHVGDSIVKLFERFDDARGGAYHIVNDRSITTRDLSNVLAEFPSFYVPRYIPPHAFRRENLREEERRYYDLVVRPYTAYMKRRGEFSNVKLRAMIDMPKSVDGVTLLRRSLTCSIKDGYMGKPSDIAITDYKDMADEQRFEAILS